MSAVTYLTEGHEWSVALTEAKSYETLRAVVEGWMPFVPDAQAIVNAMGASEFEQWRDGLAIERKGHFAGEDFARRFGALLLPEQLLRGQIVANKHGAPLGTALLRMAEAEAERV